MADYKFNVGDYVTLDKPSVFYSRATLGEMYEKTFAIRRRYQQPKDGKQYNKYDLGAFSIEEEALSLAIPFENTPDYAIGDIVLVIQPDSGYARWKDKQCEVIGVRSFSEIDDSIDSHKANLVKLKDNNSGQTEWFYTHEIRHEQCNIEPLTEDEVMSIIG